MAVAPGTSVQRAHVRGGQGNASAAQHDSDRWSRLYSASEAAAALSELTGGSSLSWYNWHKLVGDVDKVAGGLFPAVLVRGPLSNMLVVAGAAHSAVRNYAKLGQPGDVGSPFKSMLRALSGIFELQAGTSELQRVWMQSRDRELVTTRAGRDAVLDATKGALLFASAVAGAHPLRWTFRLARDVVKVVEGVNELV